MITPQSTQPFPHHILVVDALEPYLPPQRSRYRFKGPFFDPRLMQPAWESAGLVVLADTMTLVDSIRWLHVSFSRRGRCPDYADIVRVRNAFFRADSVVVQVFPPAAEHVNVHPFCLHLWERLDDTVRLVPDLRVADPEWPQIGPIV